MVWIDHLVFQAARSTCCAATSPAAAGGTGDAAAFAGSVEKGDLARCMVARACLALDRSICLTERPHLVEHLAAFQTYVFINRHDRTSFSF